MNNLTYQEGAIKVVKECYDALPESINGVKPVYGAEFESPTTLKLMVSVGDSHADTLVSWDKETLIATQRDSGIAGVLKKTTIEAYLTLLHHVVEYSEDTDKVVYKYYDPFAHNQDAKHVIPIDDGSGIPAYKCPYCGAVYHPENFFDIGRRSQSIRCDQCQEFIRLEVAKQPYIYVNWVNFYPEI